MQHIRDQTQLTNQAAERKQQAAERKQQAAERKQHADQMNQLVSLLINEMVSEQKRQASSTEQVVKTVTHMVQQQDAMTDPHKGVGQSQPFPGGSR